MYYIWYINDYYKLLETIFNGVKIYHYCKFIGIGEFSEWLALDYFDFFSTDTETPEKNLLLDEFGGEEAVSTCCVIQCYSSDSCSAQGRNISDLNINSASPSGSTLEDSAIGSKNTNEEEGDKEGGRYNRDFRGQFNGRLTNVRIWIKTTLWVCNRLTKFNNNSYYC